MLFFQRPGSSQPITDADIVEFLEPFHVAELVAEAEAEKAAAEEAAAEEAAAGNAAAENAAGAMEPGEGDAPAEGGDGEDR